MTSLKKKIPTRRDRASMGDKRLADIRRQKMAFHGPALRKFMDNNRPLVASAKAGGWFDDLIDGLIDTAEEYGDMFYPGIRQGAGIARKLKERFMPTKSNKAGSAAKEVKKEIAKEAASVGIQTGAPPSHKRTYFHSKRVINGESHVVGCELVKMLPAAAYAIGDVVYKVAINPTTLPCPKLKRTVRGYERVKVRSLSFTLDSACGSTKAGQLAVLVDRDPKDTWLSGGETIARAALSHSTCKQHSLWQSSTLHVGPSPLLWVDNDDDPEAVRFDTFGTYVIVCTQAITNDVTLGVISCSYDFVVEQPAENDQIVGGSFLQLAATGGCSLGTLQSITASALSTIPYHVVTASQGQLSVDAAGAFYVHLAIDCDAGFNITASQPLLTVGNATAYTGLYGEKFPRASGTSLSNDLTHASYSTVVYADSPWTLTILGGAAAAAGTAFISTTTSTWLNSGALGLLRLWIIGLDSLPFASLGAARRAKLAADAVTKTKKLVDLITQTDSTATASSSSTSSLSSGSSSSATTRSCSSLSPPPLLRTTEDEYVTVVRRKV